MNVVVTFVSFYSLVRLQAPHGKSSDDKWGVFGYALFGAILWPIAWVWILASRPTRKQLKQEEQERLRAAVVVHEHEEQQRRFAEMREAEHRARIRKLEVGEDDS
jgi:hypothetical protein